MMTFKTITLGTTQIQAIQDLIVESLECMVDSWEDLDAGSTLEEVRERVQELAQIKSLCSVLEETEWEPNGGLMNIIWLGYQEGSFHQQALVFKALEMSLSEKEDQ